MLMPPEARGRLRGLLWAGSPVALLTHLRKVRHFWPVALTVFLADCAAKSLAEEGLRPQVSHPVLGEFLRFTLVYNRSAAMSLDLGGRSGVLLSAIALGALVGLWL
jgi:lipoprotein signal peptidase